MAIRLAYHACSFNKCQISAIFAWRHHMAPVISGIHYIDVDIYWTRASSSTITL